MPCSAHVRYSKHHKTIKSIDSGQDVHLLALIFAHRRSCSLLQRDPNEEKSINQKVYGLYFGFGKEFFFSKLKDVLLHNPGLKDAEDDINHLDTIDHTNCVYGDRPLTIDVDDFISGDLKTKVIITLKTDNQKYVNWI